MPKKNHRDAKTGRWTTAKDAAKRPGETVSETVPARHETPDDAELRRLAEACPMPGSDWYEFKGLTKRYILSADAAFIAAASPATVLGLLDRLAHMTEARDNARAEVERLAGKLAAIEADDDDKLSIMSGWLVYDLGKHTCGGYGPESGYAHEPGCGFEPVLRLDKLQGWPEVERLAGQIEAVRALHYAADNDVHRTPVCETCHGKAGVHECGCWSPEDRQPVCGHCNEERKGMYPCPTIRILDGWAES